MNWLKTGALIALLLAACGDNSKSTSQTPDAEAEETFDQTVSVPDLDGKVSAYFDNRGVLHAECSTDADCYAAQGYFHAAHRFFQMDLRRRLARGRLSELAGPILLDTDERSRTVLATKTGGRIEQSLWDNATPKTKAAIEAYTRGVNAWIDDLRNERNGAALSAEYDFSIIDKTNIANWDVLDSAACFVPLMDQLTNRAGSDLLAAEAVALLGADVAADLFGQQTPSASTILEQPKTKAAIPAKDARRAAQQQQATMSKFLSVIKDAKRMGTKVSGSDEVGSNNWVVAPSLGNGKALLANDPHLALSNPSIWYMNHLDAKTNGEGNLHIAGASFVGLPGILFGQNENIAWGVTTTFFDQSDVYLETLNAAGTAVIFNGEEHPLINVDYEYKVSGAEPVTRRAQYVPHHGPVLSIDTDAGVAVSLRWAAQDATTDLNFLTEIWEASTTEEARVALLNVTSPGQNFVVIDTAGSIGWYPYNNVPSRPWRETIPAHLPLPGDGSAEWDGYLDYADLPQATNPPTGYIATANNDMTGAMLDGDPANESQLALQSHVADGYRHERIAQRIEARDDHDVESMQDIQADTHSLYGERVTALLTSDLDNALILSADAAKLRDILKVWDYKCPSGFDNTDPANPVASTDAATIASSQGCAAFHVLWSRLRLATFQDELDDAGAELPLRHQAMALALLRPDDLSQTYWDDVSTVLVETKADIVVAAAEAAATFLVAELGSDESNWRWGALHTLTLRADLFDGAAVPDFNSDAFINDGALSTVDVASPINDIRNNYAHSAGASTRLTCSADASGVACNHELPGGQRHHRSSNFYLSLLEKYLANEPSALGFSIVDARASAAESVRVE